MKIRVILLGIMMSALAGSAQADTFNLSDAHYTALVRMNTLSTLALINWKVGDSQDLKVTLEGIGIEGTNHKEATKEEGNGIWLKSELNLQIMNDTQELLFDRNSAKILKFIHNGKEEAMPDEKIDIVRTENTSITVPAGTFKCMHIVAKSDKVPQIELWENNRDVSLDGALKEYMDQGQVKISMELVKFRKQ